MSVRQTYTCDLCEEELGPGELIGLRPAKVDVAWEAVAADKAERHVCKECAYAIRVIMDRRER